ncbi:MAG: low temperature requirement protein A [Bdellovibrionota bacterium]
MSLAYFIKTFAVFIPLWITWTGFTYYSNRYNVDDIFHRILVFLKMFCVGAMGMSIYSLFHGKPLAFGLSYAFSQFLIFLLYLRSWKQQTVGADYAKYWGYAFLINGALWIAALFWGSYFYIGWIFGVAIVMLAPLSPYARSLANKYPFDHEHLSERYGLLTIIVLGESFVKVLSELCNRLCWFLHRSFKLVLPYC